MGLALFGLLLRPRRPAGRRPAWQEGRFRRHVRTPDLTSCLRCGGPVEGGCLIDDESIKWSPDGRLMSFDQERLDDAGFMQTPRLPALRCVYCRLVWFEY